MCSSTTGTLQPKFFPMSNFCVNSQANESFLYSRLSKTVQKWLNLNFFKSLRNYTDYQTLFTRAPIAAVHSALKLRLASCNISFGVRFWVQKEGLLRCAGVAHVHKRNILAAILSQTSCIRKTTTATQPRCDTVPLRF